MILLFLVFVLVSFPFCVGEAYWERDWPRNSFKGFVASLVLLAY